MIFEPLTNFVVIELEDESETLPGLITVVGTLEPRVRYGTVLVAGPDCREVRRGQRVLCSITAGVELPDHNAMLIRESAILAHAV